MRHVERGRDRTAVRILTAVFEQISVQRFVQIVHGIVEREQHDLRRFIRQNSTWIHDINNTDVKVALMLEIYVKSGIFSARKKRA